MSVVDESGKTLIVKQLQAKVSSVNLNVSLLESGVYYIQIQSSNAKIVRKFVRL